MTPDSTPGVNLDDLLAEAMPRPRDPATSPLEPFVVYWPSYEVGQPGVSLGYCYDQDGVLWHTSGPGDQWRDLTFWLGLDGLEDGL